MLLKNNSHISVSSGYSQALNLAKAHYENFPVISVLIPLKFRNDIAIIYWFARTADDISDEGNISQQIRLESLKSFEERFEDLVNKNFENNLEAALANTIHSRNLNPQHFINLIKAFRQDVIKTRYKNFGEVLNYCSDSANPVGRLLLELFEVRNENAYNLSDKICTALQITNFIQDTTIDFGKGRIYYPEDEMEKFGVNEKMFEMNEISDNLKKLIEFSVNRVQDLFNEGKPLLDFLSGRFKYEITWTIRGGEEILNKIRGAEFDIFIERPYLTKTDYLKLFFKSFFLR